jgi:hypothetical protein
MTVIRKCDRVGLVLLLASSLSGCAHRHDVLGVDCCADIPAGAIPEPPGTKLCNWQSMQVNAATADQFVLYQCDFVGDSTNLSPAALARIGRLAQSGSASNMSWVVEPSGDGALDLARMDAAINELTGRGVSPVDVTIATPAALGLAGTLAEGILGRQGGRGNSTFNSGGRGGTGFGFGGFGGFGSEF